MFQALGSSGPPAPMYVEGRTFRDDQKGSCETLISFVPIYPNAFV
jgi:hypothetical protein